MLGALWINLEFDDGATAEGLIRSIPTEARAALRELRANAARLGGIVVGGTTLGRGVHDPVKAVLNVIFQATGLPGGSDMRPALATLWLTDEGILADVRGILGGDFARASQRFLLDSSFAAAALKAKPNLAPDLDVDGSPRPAVRDRTGADARAARRYRTEGVVSRPQRNAAHPNHPG